MLLEGSPAETAFFAQGTLLGDTSAGDPALWGSVDLTATANGNASPKLGDDFYDLDGAFSLQVNTDANSSRTIPKPDDDIVVEPGMRIALDGFLHLLIRGKEPGIQ